MSNVPVSLFNKLREEVIAGKEGLNAGFFTGLSTFGRYFGHVTRSRYVIIGGDTGTGKTAFVDEAWLLAPIEFLMEHPEWKINYHCNYFSLEISTTEKIAKIVCRRIYKTKGILLDSDYIMGKLYDAEGNLVKISDEHQALVEECESYINEISKYITFIDGKTTPKRFHDIMESYYNANGTFEIKKNKHTYIPKDKYAINVTIIDTLNLLNKGEHAQKKDAIDAVSKDIIYYRNICGGTFVGISQFNRGIQSTERAKLGFAPQLSDFKDTSDTQEDANLVLALFSPARYKQTVYEDYKITLLKDRFRMIFILKNRNGPAEIKKGLLFIGEAGIFKELPDPDKITEKHYAQVKSITHELLKLNPSLKLVK